MLEAVQTGAAPQIAHTYLTSKPAKMVERDAATADEEEVAGDQEEPLNIVLFYADDWTLKVVGKLNRLVNTPNIDKMADNGMMFTQNCVTTSVCWISRATLMTGLYAARHRQTEPWKTNNIFDLHPWNETLFPLLKQKGYYTGIVGKWHGPQVKDKLDMAFDHMLMYYGRHWESRGGQTRHVTDLNREDAIDFLRHRPKDQKFALKVSFFATHAWDGKYPSYQPMNESKVWYNNVTVPMPKTNTEHHFKLLPPFFTNRNEGRNRWRKRFEPSYYQESIKDLYRMATEVDFAVGEIISELKEQGLESEHGLAEKWYPFEESIRVPLIIQDPRMSKDKHGSTSDKFTLNIDLAPTLLGAAQVKPSRFMQGRDIADIYLKSNAPWRKDFFYEYNRGHPITGQGHEGTNWIDASFALVTKEWKYIYWPEHNYEQLFHRSLDPYEEADLMKNKSALQTSNEMYFKMKARYNYLKMWAQSGKRV
eukprot:scaffold9903_cov94-Cylindrotheca_fusiformis.AAC.1